MSSSPQKLRFFFVSGSPKSGTTWVQRILDTHPQVACAGEGHFVESIIGPMTRVLAGYNDRLKLVDERVYQGRSPYARLTQAEMVQIIRDLVLRLMLRQNPPPGVRWVGDKTPRYAEGLQHLRTLFPGARFIHILRDPRDVAVSRLFHAVRAGYPDATTPGAEVYYKLVRNAAEAWRSQNEKADAFKQSHAQSVHELTYERLLTEFQETASRLFAFLEVGHSPEILAKVEQETDFAKLSGRPRGEEDASSFFRKGVVGDWQGRLDAQALAIIEEWCGNLMRAKGYA